jgi:hypothetical protein
MIGPNLTNDRGWPCHWRQLYEALGVEGTHLPAEGLPTRQIGNVWVWVEAKEMAHKEAVMDNMAFVHRVRCRCPKCFKQLSAGRLHQHLKACKGPRR